MGDFRDFRDFRGFRDFRDFFEFDVQVERLQFLSAIIREQMRLDCMMKIVYGCSFIVNVHFLSVVLKIQKNSKKSKKSKKSKNSITVFWNPKYVKYLEKLLSIKTYAVKKVPNSLGIKSILSVWKFWIEKIVMILRYFGVKCKHFLNEKRLHVH